MDFNPRYTITNRLLDNIKRVNTLVTELNYKRFPNLVLFNLERIAREVSSYASTSIEGNPLPLTEVKKILKTAPKNIRQTEQEVLNYNQALQDLNKRLQAHPFPLSLDLILTIHRQVMTKLLPPYQIGQFRVEPVVVNDPRTGETIYLPPNAPDVAPMVTALVDFTNQQQGTIDPLIIAGIFHKQFVVIHPFMDGNGRTTRLATKVLLAQMGLNTFNLFSFENYYNKNVTRYFSEVGMRGDFPNLANQIDFTAWLEYFTEGIIDELLRVQKILSASTITPQAQLQPHHRALLDFIKRKGFATNKDYAKLTSRAKATRILDLEKLLNLGLIIREGKGKATYYKLTP